MYEAGWRHRAHDGHVRTLKRRLGPGWLARSDGVYSRRRGRVKPGFLDEHAAIVAKDKLIREVEEELARRENDAANAAAAPVTFRAVAHAYLDWLARVKGAKPATLRDHRYLLPSQALRADGAAALTAAPLWQRWETAQLPRLPRERSTSCSRPSRLLEPLPVRSTSIASLSALFTTTRLPQRRSSCLRIRRDVLIAVLNPNVRGSTTTRPVKLSNWRVLSRTGLTATPTLLPSTRRRPPHAARRITRMPTWFASLPTPVCAAGSSWRCDGSTLSSTDPRSSFVGRRAPT